MKTPIVRYAIALALVAGALTALGSAIFNPSSSRPSPLASISPRSQTAQVSAPTSGLVGYWTFDEGSGSTAADSSGNGNNGTLANFPSDNSEWVSGTVGSGALQFGGTNQEVIAPCPATGITSYSISGWIKTSSTPILSAMMSWGNNAYIMDDTAHGTGFTTDGAFLDGAHVGTSLIDGKWHHIVGTYDGVNDSLYIDGALAATATNTSTLQSGCAIGYAYTYFNGSIDDVRVYNRALSASEVTNLYGLGSSQTAASNPAPAGQTVLYVTPNGSGTKNGSDWNNAYAGLPGSLIRGDTYYLAGGSYGSHTFDDADSGTQMITVKKATASDHGTDTGWSSSYGETQAVLTAPVVFYTDYYAINGASRTDWKTGYGIKVSNYPNPLHIEDVELLGVHNITLSFVEIEGSHEYREVPNDCGDVTVGPLADGGPFHDDGIDLTSTSNILVDSSSIHDVGGSNVILLANGNTGFTLQNSYIARDFSTPTCHENGISAQSGTYNMTIRYNWFEDVQGTADIASPTGGPTNYMGNWYIYGNVFSQSNGGDAGVGLGPIAIFGATATGDIFIYNNTIANFNPMSGSGGGEYWIIFGTAGTPVTADRVYIKNNLWWNSWDYTWDLYPINFGNLNAKDVQVSNNAYYGIPTTAVDLRGVTLTLTIQDSDPNKQISPGNPFVGWTNSNFRLTAPTQSGAALPAPFNIDPDGNVRGADGTWDRGAYEYNSGQTGGTQPPSPVNGSCSTTLNQCTQGTFSDITDTSTSYLWSCTGSNGGTTASCSLPITVAGGGATGGGGSSGGGSGSSSGGGTPTPVSFSNISVVAAPTTATISWTTPSPVLAQARYGLTASYGSQTSQSALASTSHAFTISNLAPNTTYHYSLVSLSSATNIQSISSDYAFTTPKAGTQPVVTVPAIVAPTAIAGCPKGFTCTPNPTTKNQIPTTSYRFTRTLILGSTGSDVKALQQFLNAHGFTVSAKGNGSPGHETTYYGPATASAISRFQLAHSAQILAPLGLTQGTGNFGSATMKAVNGMR